MIKKMPKVGFIFSIRFLSCNISLFATNIHIFWAPVLKIALGCLLGISSLLGTKLTMTKVIVNYFWRILNEIFQSSAAWKFLIW